MCKVRAGAIAPYRQAVREHDPRACVPAETARPPTMLPVSTAISELARYAVAHLTGRRPFAMPSAQTVSAEQPAASPTCGNENCQSLMNTVVPSDGTPALPWAAQPCLCREYEAGVL
jgi:hypothetical protein